MIESVGPALLLSLFAGLSTGIGSAIAYLIKKPKLGYLAFALGLSAGVMLYVSFVELLGESMAVLGDAWAVVLFFVGMGVIAVIDALVPEIENPHHLKTLQSLEADKTVTPPPVVEGTTDTPTGTTTDAKETDVPKSNAAGADGTLMRTGVLTALVITIHNFPEGLATFGIALGDLSLGAVIAFAIAVHNIPEGLSVSIPIYYATGDKKKAFTYSFLSGVAEPVGALLGLALLYPFLSDAVIGGLFFCSGSSPASWSTSRWTRSCRPRTSTGRATPCSRDSWPAC